MAITGHQHVRVTIVVKISYRYTLTVKAHGADAGLFRDIGKSPIAVVVIKDGP